MNKYCHLHCQVEELNLWIGILADVANHSLEEFVHANNVILIDEWSEFSRKILFFLSHICDGWLMEVIHEVFACESLEGLQHANLFLAS